MNASELTEDNVFIFAAKNYYSPLGVDPEEFNEDLKRFKYIKRLVNRYVDSGDIATRLVLNHLIVVFNVFGIEGGMAIINLKMGHRQMTVIKPFLIFLKAIEHDDSRYTGIEQDFIIVDELRKI